MGSTTPTVAAQWVASSVQRLRGLGWLEGRDVAIEYRWAEGRSERYTEIAAEFVRLKVDVILTHNTPTVLAAKQATSAIPIVFATAGDPIGSGLVATLARPGGNVTGVSSQGSDTTGKRLELLREVVPGLRRFAVLANLASSANSRPDRATMRKRRARSRILKKLPPAPGRNRGREGAGHDRNLVRRRGSHRPEEPVAGRSAAPAQAHRVTSVPPPPTSFGAVCPNRGKGAARNSCFFIRSPRRRGRAASVVPQDRAPSRSPWRAAPG
jgi:hypothetical protein